MGFLSHLDIGRKYHEGDFPDVVIPLADAPRDLTSPSQQAEMPVKDDLSTSEKGIVTPPSVGSEQGAYSAHTLEALRQEIEYEVEQDGHDTVYDRKAKLINKAMTDIGMGKYQWQLFVLCGFGWAADIVLKTSA
ncbi:hypothetical protein KEM52_004456 [Ascosphaera acerosa]|nr:hypothetical protein KEM52_004456 [Ascosphaera acerosa]